MPKVAHFIDSHDPGGAETVVIEICRKIDTYGFTPEVYHFGNPWLEEKCREYNIPSFFVPGHRFYTSVVTLPLFTPIFIRFLRYRHVDILHSHLFGPVTGASFATYLAGIPHIGTFHDIYTIEEKPKRVRYIRLSSILGTRLITVSHQMKTYLASLGKFDNKTLETIVNGVDTDRFNLTVGRKQYPDLRLKTEDIVLTCVGRLEKIKGHDILLKAVKKIKPKDHVKLLIVGEGPCRQEIERQINEEGMKGTVLMLGQRNDIPALLNLSDCFVLSSRSEGLSCSIIEAMAAGLPVVATDVGGNSELVANGINGYLVPPDDSDALYIRLQAVINDAAMRIKFGQMSLKRVREYYSLDIMMNKYVNHYGEMIANRRGSSLSRFRKDRGHIQCK
jgi:glycosyltransferase involved in cell wall biosynthesis